MHGTDRTLRPELGSGGKQHTRQVVTPDGIENRPVGLRHDHQTAVGVSNDRIQNGEAVYPGTSFDPAHQRALTERAESRRDKDTADTTPDEPTEEIELESAYAAVYQGSDLLANASSVPRATKAEVLIYDHGDTVSITINSERQVDGWDAKKSLYTTLDLSPAAATALALRLLKAVALAPSYTEGGCTTVA